MQFSQAEQTDDYGIAIANKVFRGWLYGCSFDKYLFNVRHIESMKNDPDIAEKARALIKRYFCGASVRIEMIPDTKLI